MMKALIVIIGPVGVGKSTIISLLRKSLKERGISVSTTFLKAFHGLSIVIWQLMSKLMFGLREITSLQSMTAPWYGISKLDKRLAWRLTLLTALIDALFSIPLRLLYIYTLRSMGYVVLCEEYLYGTLTDYLYTFTNARTCKGREILSFVTKIFISELSKVKPSVVVILDANINGLLNRWRKRGYGDPQLRYVMFQKAFFNWLMTGRLLPMHDLKVLYITTSKLNEDTTLRIVLENVLKLCQANDG